ncbi:hypothetical protein F5J12DRAFT_787030, partial [Pisolithus orientalis]|uniref:uncharacterized protein n=1 Tax=Pisolithus orientalis TaxID=936130 RepID=UPI002224E50D
MFLMSLLELGLVALHAVTGWLIAELSIIDWVEVPGDIGDNTRVLCRITNTYREIRYKLVLDHGYRIEWRETWVHRIGTSGSTKSLSPAKRRVGEVTVKKTIEG